jgi:hypothetical protein
LEKYNHQDKAEIIWEAFKDRMVNSEFTEMHFDLRDLIQRADDLEGLIIPFTKEEIDQIVKNLPSGKSPSPDGFNTDFIKKCWDIISPDLPKVLQPGGWRVPAALLRSGVRPPTWG